MRRKKKEHDLDWMAAEMIRFRERITYLERFRDTFEDRLSSLEDTRTKFGGLFERLLDERLAEYEALKKNSRRRKAAPAVKEVV